MEQMVFARKEIKYILPPDVYAPFAAEIARRMQEDRHGEYRICNLYYDTEHFDLIRMSIDKPLYKEKLRIRSYGTPGPDTPVYIEIKKKYDGIVYKRRETLPYAAACAFLNSGVYPEGRDSQIMREIRYFLSHYRPRPALYLSYLRHPFALPEEDLRVTFDSDVRYRFENTALCAGDTGELLLPPDVHLMEIKTGTAYPLWLSHLLDEYHIRRTSFSKYGRIYQRVFAARGGMGDIAPARAGIPAPPAIL